MKKTIAIFLILIFNLNFAEEIFLSITKNAIDKKFIPSNFEIITEKQIMDSKAKNLGEILELFTSVDISRMGSLGSAKTLRLRYSTSDQVLILINGTPINTNGQTAFNLSLIPTDIIEKIEIFPVSCSALYGTNSIAGIVNVVTKKSYEQKNKISTNFSYGDFNTYVINQDINYLKEKYGIYINLNYQHSNGWRQNSEYNAISGYSNFELPVFVGKLSLTNLVNNANTGSPGPTSVPMEEWNSEKEKSATTPYAKQIDNLNLISLSYQDSSITSSISLNTKKLIYDNSQDQFWPEKTNSEITNLNFLNNFNINNKILISLNYNYTQIDQKYPLQEFNNFKKDVSNLGFSVQKDFIYKNLNLIPTIRWDSNSIFGNKFSYQLILVNNFRKTKFSLILGNAWRTPTFFDLYWPNQIWIKGNPNLKVEESYSLDLALENNIESVNIIFNPFYRYIKDLIRWRQQDPNDIFSPWMPFNDDEAISQGIEIKINFILSKIFKNKIFITISDNKIKLKTEQQKGWQKQPYSPFITLNYLTNLTLINQFNIYSFLKYVDTQYSGNNETGLKLKSFLLWDITFEKNFNNYLKFYFKINDILNQKGVNRAGYPQPGTNYEIGLNFNF